jgi:hypothetical protein
VLANDSILTTPGSGATVATQLVGSNEHLAVVPCANGAESPYVTPGSGYYYGGRIRNQLPLYVVQTGFISAANNKVHFSLFTVDHTGETEVYQAYVWIWAVFLQKDLSSVTGAVIDFALNRISAVTSGTALTPVRADTISLSPVSSMVSTYHTVTGATVLSTILNRKYHSEESNNAAQIEEILPLWPPVRAQPSVLQPIFCGPGQGISVSQANGTTSNWNTSVLYSMEWLWVE